MPLSVWAVVERWPIRVSTGLGAWGLVPHVVSGWFALPSLRVRYYIAKIHRSDLEKWSPRDWIEGYLGRDCGSADYEGHQSGGRSEGVESLSWMRGSILGAAIGLTGTAGRLAQVRCGAALGWALPRIREAHSPKEMLRASADRLNASARVGGGGLCALVAGRGTEGIGISP